MCPVGWEGLSHSATLLSISKPLEALPGFLRGRRDGVQGRGLYLY